jgi:hypothetical protein
LPDDKTKEIVEIPMDDVDVNVESSERNYIPPETNEKEEISDRKNSINETDDSALASEVTYKKDDIESSINSIVADKKGDDN